MGTDLQTVAKWLDKTLNSGHTAAHSHREKTGFCLLTFGFNAPGISNYVSNANRQDMIKALRETADRLERNEDNPRGA